jgi:hypothetical protein
MRDAGLTHLIILYLITLIILLLSRAVHDIRGWQVVAYLIMKYMVENRLSGMAKPAQLRISDFSGF